MRSVEVVRLLPGRRAATEQDEQPTAVPDDAGDEVGSGKGRPTPRRRDAEAARRTRARVPRTKREAQLASREERRDRQVQMREAMATGDERYLPERDKGPVKRYVRDTIDSRRHLAEYSLPFVLVVTFVSIPFAAVPGLTWVPNIVLLATVLLVVGDAALTARRLRAGITARFGAHEAKGRVMYGVMRSTQFRRIRQPKPQVRPGDTV